MTPPLAVTAADRPLYRISRRPNAWAWPPWSSAGPDGTFGNRFDDPRGEYRVLYASSQRIGAFLETLARFRRDVAIDTEYSLIQPDERDDTYPTLEPGLIPADWRDKRYIGTASHEGRFVDVGHSDSVAHLRSALAARLLHYSLDDLDAGDLRRRAPRRFTQELSRYVFETGYDQAGATLAGIRYLSRLGDEIVNWAMFEGADPEGRPTPRSSATIQTCWRRWRSSTSRSRRAARRLYDRGEPGRRSEASQRRALMTAQGAARAARAPTSLEPPRLPSIVSRVDVARRRG